jgi:hypothetical protein
MDGAHREQCLCDNHANLRPDWIKPEPSNHLNLGAVTFAARKKRSEPDLRAGSKASRD